jgi:hypothetical protein
MKPRKSKEAALNRWIIAMIAALAAAALAGEILRADCDACDYTEGDLWLGSGLEDPFGVFVVYWVADWNRVVSVEFDLSAEFGRIIGYDFAPVRHEQTLWDVVESHYAEYEDFTNSWSPPAVIEGDMPPGAWLSSDGPVTGPYPRMLLVEGIWEEGRVFPCPACGERTLRFTVIGEWD